MEKYVLEGNKKLKGRVRLSGAKNSALKIMAAAILGNSPSVIEDIPRIKDVEVMMEVLKTLGVKAEFTDKNVVKIDPSSISNYNTPYEFVRKMRASITILGPLIAKMGKARVALPGGCNIGSRPIDLNISSLTKLGAKITQESGFIDATAPDGLKGNYISMDFPSRGATENILMASVLATGRTIIENAAREPELVDLANFLVTMGADIQGIGTDRLIIEGVEELKGIKYKIIPDPIEMGTFIVIAAVTNGEIFIEGAKPEMIRMAINKFRECGVNILEKDNGILVSMDKKPEPMDISTLPFPGFPTDLQPLATVLVSLSSGVSIITENIFENRFTYINELNRMGANIRTDGHHAVIRGVDKLTGVPVTAPDLRAGAALVTAGLAAEGVTEIYDIYHIDRGYENLEDKLTKLGAKISRVKLNETL